MNEQKEYISQVRENGALHISEDVLSSIAGITVSEIEGVTLPGSGIGSEIADILGKKNLGRGIHISIADDNVITVDCTIFIEIGFSILDICKNVQEAVASNIESVTGFRVSSVNVTVAGVALSKDSKK